MVLERVIDRGKRLAWDLAALGHVRPRDIADLRRCRELGRKTRPPRSIESIDGLPKSSALVVVAHPDDEVAAAGVILSRLSRLGIIYVTDGAPRRGSDARNAGFTNWIDYAGGRRRETENALALLGREIAPRRNLGIADQEATYELVDTSRCLAEHFRAGFDYVITHPYEGGHPDHDATAFCVHAACRLIAQGGGTPPAIVEARFYAAPQGRYVFSEFLAHPDAGPALALNLTPEEIALKRRMCALHASQQKHLVQFRLEEEVYRLAPRYHFSAPPHPGDVGFNQFKWPLSGRIWRFHARRAMRQLDLVEDLT